MRFALFILRDLKVIWPDARLAPTTAKCLKYEGCRGWLIETKHHARPSVARLVQTMNQTHGSAARWLLIFGMGDLLSREGFIAAIHPYAKQDHRLRLKSEHIDAWVLRDLVGKHDGPKARYVIWRNDSYMLWRWEGWLHSNAPLGLHAALFGSRRAAEVVVPS